MEVGAAGPTRRWRVREATAADAEALAALHLDCWEDAYEALMPSYLLAGLRQDLPARIRRWRDRLSDGPPTVVAETDDALIGFAVAGPPRDDSAPAPLELYALYTRSAYWGTPVGWALFRRAVGAGGASLWVLEGNERAIRFYRRQGFAADGEVKEADVGRELRMVREAEPPARPRLR